MAHLIYITFYLVCGLFGIANADATEFLIEKSIELKIDLNAKNIFGDTAFHRACYNDKTEVVKKMLAFGQAHPDILDLTIKDNYGKTGFHHACLREHSKIAEVLVKKSIEFNIDLNSKNVQGRTAFHLACLCGSAKTIEMMLDFAEIFKIDLKAEDNVGKTGFQIAKRHRKIEVFNLIQKKMPSIAVFKN